MEFLSQDTGSATGQGTQFYVTNTSGSKWSQKAQIQ